MASAFSEAVCQGACCILSGVLFFPSPSPFCLSALPLSLSLLFYCNAQLSSKHPVSLQLLLLLPLGLHPLYMGFIPPLWLRILFHFVSVFPPCPLSSSFSRFSFFFLTLSSHVIFWGIFHYLLPSTSPVCHPSLRCLLPAYQPLSFSPFCHLLVPPVLYL